MRPARTSTDQDVVELLIAQHDQIKDLLRRVASATGPEKRQMFGDLVALLAVHESAEDQIAHPAARSAGVNDTVIAARLREEALAKQALSELYDLGPDDPRFDDAFAAFASDVVVHASREEAEEFRTIRERYSPEDLRRLANTVRVAQASAPGRPHPGGESATATLPASPPLAIFDHVCDAMSDATRNIRRSSDETSEPMQRAQKRPPSRTTRAVVAAAAGSAATVIMSGWMLAGQALTNHGEQAPKRVLRGVVHWGGIAATPHGPLTLISTAAAHLGFGVSCGALYGALAPRSTVTRGIAYGLGVWATSYAGWIPALGVLPPPQRDRPGRQLTVLTAHAIYGAILGGAMAAYDNAIQKRTDNRQS